MTVRLRSDADEDSKKPIKLLEVNEDTTADGIRPIFFGPHPASAVLFPSVIIEVTPEEFSQIQQGTFLPNGWRLGEELARPSAQATGV